MVTRRDVIQLGLVSPLALAGGTAVVPELALAGTAAAGAGSLSSRLRNAPKGPFPRELSYAVSSRTLCVQLILNRYTPGAYVSIDKRSGAGVAAGPNLSWWRQFDVWTEDPLSPAFVHGKTSASAPTPTAAVDGIGSWRITSTDDPSWGSVTPGQIWRKSKIIDRALNGPYAELAAPVMQHRIYFGLPKPMAAGKSYTVRFTHPVSAGLSFTVTHQHRPQTNWTECLHISQEGYHPDEPVKLFFVSQWMGHSFQGGTPYITYDDLPFQVVNGNNAVVLQGRLQSDSALTDRFGTGATAENLAYAPSWKGDISALRTPGTSYRICIPDIGVSYPFAITREKWHRLTAMTTRGATYYACASRPKTEAYAGAEYVKPAHRPKGSKILKSNARCEFTSMNPAMTGSLKLYPSHAETFAYLRDSATGVDIGKTVEGGWDDAADWDCRSMAFYLGARLLTYYEMSWAYWNGLDLETDNPKGLPGSVPDLLREVHHLLDFFRLLQEAWNDAGGVPGAKGVPAGVEYAEHPKSNETSFANTHPVYSWAPDVYTSYLFAGAAAQWAYCLRRVDPSQTALIDRFKNAAIAAYAYARGANYTATRNGRSATAAQVRTDPATKTWAAYAAMHLYRLTRSTAYHDDFLSLVDSRNFICTAVYGSSLWPGEIPLDGTKRATLRTSLAGAADAALKNKVGGFGMRSQNLAKPAWANNTPSIPGEAGDIMCYQHFVAPSEPMLRAILEETLYGLGANPANLCHITRCGIEWPYGATQVDYTLMGKNPTPGIVVFGMNRMQGNPEGRIERIRDKVWPHWPTKWPGMEEFTHWGNLAATHEWGQEHLAFWPCVASYLAARLG